MNNFFANITAIVLGTAVIISLVPDSKIKPPAKEQEVKKALKGIEVLIFKASWCGPCNSAAMKRLPKDLKAKGIAVRIIDIDAQPALAAKYDVRVVPTTIVLKDGQVEGRKVGVVADVALILKIIAGILKKIIPYLLEFWGL